MTTAVRASVLALTLAIFATQAKACSDLPNICQQQMQIHNQNVDDSYLAAQNYGAWVEDTYFDNGGGFDDPVPPPRAFDPMQAKINQALGTMLEAQKRIEDKAKLMKDPKYKAYINGSWTYFQDTNAKKPGEFCSAFFTRAEGFAMLSGPGSGYDGALLTFWGMNVPKPKEVRKIKVTLKQTDDKPQTVTAFNYYNAAHGMGAIALAVPSIEAAPAGILDKHEFELVVGGKSVAKVKWHSGLAMKKKLATCVAKRVAGN
jgi:hypothetical protein